MDLGISYMGMIVSMTRVCTISKEENANGKEQMAPSDKSKIYTLRKAVKKITKDRSPGLLLENIYTWPFLRPTNWENQVILIHSSWEPPLYRAPGMREAARAPTNPHLRVRFRMQILSASLTPWLCKNRQEHLHEAKDTWDRTQEEGLRSLKKED